MKKTTLSLVICLSLVISMFTMVPPSHVSADPAPFNYGDVFAGVGYGLIRHYDSAGNFIEDLDTLTGSSEQTGMGWDAAGNLYATSFTTSELTRFDNNGNWIGSFGSGYSSHPESIVFDSLGNVYVGQADGTRDIKKFDAAGNPLTDYTVATEYRGSDWIDLAADQTTIYYTSEGYLIKCFDVSTNTQLSDFATLPERPAYALRILSDGGVLVAATNNCYRLDNTGTIVQTYPKPVGETSFLFALNLDPDGTSFWTAGYATGNVYKIDIASSAVLMTINTRADGPVNTLAGLTVYGERTAPGSIAGTKFNDLNGDGIRDVGESGLAGWTIELADASGTPVATTTTDANGRYLFTLLPDGTYTVSEVLQAGWTQTVPTSGTYTITIEQGADITDVDFGNTEREVNPIPLFSDILLLLSLGLIAGAMVIQRRRKAKNKN